MDSFQTLGRAALGLGGAVLIDERFFAGVERLLPALAGFFLEVIFEDMVAMMDYMREVELTGLPSLSLSLHSLQASDSIGDWGVRAKQISNTVSA